MHTKQIELDFGEFILEAELFDTSIAKKFAEKLPYSINLTQWGKELYGSIGVNFGEENPVSDIPPGGIAYTNKNYYLCIFFGQAPAWEVEHIGQIIGDHWKHLINNSLNTSVTVKEKQQIK